MPLKFKTFITIIAFIFTFGCIENFNPEIDPGLTDLIFVDGRLTNNSPAQVKIGRTVKFGETSEGESIVDATITLLQNGEVFDVLNHSAGGTYQGTKLGSLNQTYELEIELNDGRIIHSQPQTISPGPEVGDLYLDRVEKDILGVNGGVSRVQGLDVNLYLNDETTDSRFFRWKLDGTYKFTTGPRSCYIRYGFGSHFKIEESKVSEKVLLTKTLIFLQGTHEFSEGFSLEVTQYPLSPQEYNYWKQIDDQKSNQGSVFDPPPSTIIGNLNFVGDSEKVLGFFSASASTSKRIFIEPSAFRDQPQPNATCTASSSPPPWCSDCTLLPNSTTIVPTYWCETCE